MPKSVPVPVRQKLWERASRGESVNALADAFGLSPRTIRHLLKRCRDRGEIGLIPADRAPKSPDHAHPEAIRQAVLALRRDHPTWGAQLIRVMLADEKPQLAWPSPSTIRRWVRAAELARAPAGRPARASSKRAEQPHQTWQIDASEHIPLADKTEACWLRILDEATGAVLRTDVFPPRLLDSGRPSRHSGKPEAVVPALGSARATAGRQRCPLGIAGRPAHRPGLLAGGNRCRGEGQSAALSPGQWRGGTRSRGGQTVVRALDLWIVPGIATAAGEDGPRAARGLPGEARAIPAGGLSGVEPFVPALRPGTGRIDLGSAEGLGFVGHASSATEGGSRRQTLGVQPAVQRGGGVGWANGLGGLRSGGRAVDLPGRSRERDPSPSGRGVEPGIGVWDGRDASSKRSPCEETNRSVITENPCLLD
jgi:Homeodomain-like domain